MIGGNRQDSGDNSNNQQAGGDITNITIGLSYDDVYKIYTNLFKDNFYELSEKAAQLAFERSETLIKDFIDKLYKNNPTLLYKLEEPSVQYSMFNAQREFAKTGDIDLESQLLDLLIERINSEERSLKQIVLDEAISILPKLTKGQINLLSLILSVTEVIHSDILDIAKFQDMIDDRIMRFFPDASISDLFYTHLQYSGCCTFLAVGATYLPLEQILKNKFKAFFVKGFTNEELQMEFGSDLLHLKPLIMESILTPTAFQFNRLNDEGLNESIKEYNLESYGQKIKSFSNRFLMTDFEAKEYLIKLNIGMEKLIEEWTNKDFKTIRLTSVGFAIAIMNYNRQTEQNIRIDEII